MAVRRMRGTEQILAVHPLADASVTHFALDNVLYHRRNISVVWDPDGALFRPRMVCFVLFLVFYSGESQNDQRFPYIL